jgi:hypothetical protein
MKTSNTANSMPAITRKPPTETEPLDGNLDARAAEGLRGPYKLPSPAAAKSLEHLEQGKFHADQYAQAAD